MTAQNPFYRPVSEKDSQEGYVNLFLHPLLDIYKDISHSYIIELKYAKGKDSSERIEQFFANNHFHASVYNNDFM